MFKLKRLLIIALGLGLFGFFGFQLIKNKDKLFGDLDLAVNEPEPYIINMKSPIDNDPINVAKVLKHYFIKSPLSAGVSVDSIKDTQLPKAVRSYRNGMHEGIDFFRVPDGRGNVRAVTKSDTVISPGYFKVVRMDLDYKEPATSEYQRMLDETFEENIDTSSKKYQIILDKLRGRSVWLKSKDGRLILRYAHLDSISSKIKIGDILKPGTILGTVGNSGTIDGVNFREAEGLHLHFDIILDNAFIWTSFSPQQIRGILKKVLEKIRYINKKIKFNFIDNAVVLICVKEGQDISKAKASIYTDMELSNEEILNYYSNRWEIETYFRKVKNHLPL